RPGAFTPASARSTTRRASPRTCRRSSVSETGGRPAFLLGQRRVDRAAAGEHLGVFAAVAFRRGIAAGRCLLAGDQTIDGEVAVSANRSLEMGTEDQDLEQLRAAHQPSKARSAWPRPGPWLSSAPLVQPGRGSIFQATERRSAMRK